ncbi:MAG: hypothetical protein WA952_10910, partial [Lewinella sp.]
PQFIAISLPVYQTLAHSPIQPSEFRLLFRKTIQFVFILDYLRVLLVIENFLHPIKLAVL